MLWRLRQPITVDHFTQTFESRAELAERFPVLAISLQRPPPRAPRGWSRTEMLLGMFVRVRCFGRCWRCLGRRCFGRARWLRVATNRLGMDDGTCGRPSWRSDRAVGEEQLGLIKYIADVLAWHAVLFDAFRREPPRRVADGAAMWWVGS